MLLRIEKRIYRWLDARNRQRFLKEWGEHIRSVPDWCNR